MNREDIIRMAEEAGACFEGCYWTATADDLELFAALVTAAAKAEEREACAKVVDANAEQCGTAIRLILESNAAAIRARGNP